MPSNLGRTTLSPKDNNNIYHNNKLGLSQQGNYSPRRPVRSLRTPDTQDGVKDRKNKFSLGRLLPTPTRKETSSRQQRKMDDDSVTSEDIYLTSEEEYSNSAVTSFKKEGPKTVATLMTGSSSLESQKASDNSENSRPPSPTSSSPSSSSTLPSIKEVIESNAEVSYRKRNTSENIHVQYYRKIVQNRVSHYGNKDIRTAESYMELGNAQLKFHEFHGAGKSFLSALKVYQSIYGDQHLSVARALSKLGLAACKANKNLDLVIVALSDALKIRVEILGPTHVDSIDTLDNIAAVRLSMRSCVRAALDYLKVFNQRAHVFGRNHESVAATSYTLGGILCDMLEMKDDADDFFKLSLQIYEALGIEESPNVPDIRRRLGIVEGEEFEFDGYIFVNSSKEELESKLRARMRKSCPVEI